MSLFTVKAQYPGLITRYIVTLSKAHKPRLPQGCCPSDKGFSAQCETLFILSTKSEVIWYFVVVKNDFRPMKFYSGRGYTKLQLVRTLCKEVKKMYLLNIWLHVSVNRLWKTGSEVEGPCLITDKAVLDISKNLDGVWDRVWSELSLICLIFFLIHPLSVSQWGSTQFVSSIPSL